MTTRLFVGVDNGISGGVVALDQDGGIVLREKSPTVADGKKKRLCAVGFRALLAKLEPTGLFTIVVERPAGSKSVLAAVSMQDSFAKIETVLILDRHRHQFITAKTWQKEFWSVPKMPKGQKFDTKAAALLAANRLWPNADWLASPRCMVPHDGMIDAALIAEWARRKGL
jgi:hypothetical protein